MKLSTDRILTTHVGSLPRPQEVVDFLFAQDRGESYDPVKFDHAIRSGVLGRAAEAGGVPVLTSSATGRWARSAMPPIFAIGLPVSRAIPLVRRRRI